MLSSAFPHLDPRILRLALACGLVRKTFVITRCVCGVMRPRGEFERAKAGKTESKTVQANMTAEGVKKGYPKNCLTKQRNLSETTSCAQS